MSLPLVRTRLAGSKIRKEHGREGGRQEAVASGRVLGFRLWGLGLADISVKQGGKAASSGSECWHGAGVGGLTRCKRAVEEGCDGMRHET